MNETPRTKTAGANKGGENGRFIFELTKMAGIDAGTGYSTANGPVVEGERMQYALVTKKRGTGSNMHVHPNEQWNYIVKGTLRVRIGDQRECLCGPGTLLYFPANMPHATVATHDEDVVFFAVKDMSHGIIGSPVDGKPTAGHFDPGFESRQRRPVAAHCYAPGGRRMIEAN